MEGQEYHQTSNSGPLQPISKLGRAATSWGMNLLQSAQHSADCLGRSVQSAGPSFSSTANRDGVLHRNLRGGGFQMSIARRNVIRNHGLRQAPLAALIPGNSVVEQVLTTGTSNFLTLYNAALIGRIILTWFPNPPAAIAGPLSTLCDPYLNLFRGIIPPLGGTLDLSPILAFLALDLFTNTAGALPAEIPLRFAPKAQAGHAARSHRPLSAYGRLKALGAKATDRK